MFLVDWEKYVYYRVTFREENFSGYCNPMKFLSVFLFGLFNNNIECRLVFEAVFLM